MSEILLQTIVEKLESFEIALLKENDPGKEELLQKKALESLKPLQAEIKMLISELYNHGEKLKGFSKEINLLRLDLLKLEPGNFKHIHHFHKGLLVALILFDLAGVFFVWMDKKQ